MATQNVLKLPGDYKVFALDGKIYIEAGTSAELVAGGFVEITSQGDYVALEADSYISNIAGSYIANEAGGYITNDAGSYIFNLASSYISNEAGGEILNDAGSFIFNLASSYISNEAGGEILNEAGSFINNIAGSYINNEASGYVLTDAGGYIQAISGSYIEYEASSYIENIAGSEFRIDAPIIELGVGTSQKIDPKATFINDLVPDAENTYDIGDVSAYWKTLYTYEGIFKGTDNVSNPYLRPYDPTDIYGTVGQRQAGAVYVAGGVGIEKDLNVGGFIYGRIETANTSLSINVTATNVDQVLYPTFAVSTGNQFLFIDPVGIYGGLTYNPSQGKLTVDRARVAQPDQSVSTMTGAFTVTGGVGIGKDVYVGGNVLPGSVNTGSLGKEGLEWFTGYIDNVYSKFIGSTASDLTIAPGTGQTDIFGDLRVRGTNPIGTAPVVRNTLYVTMDGNDTNDGRAMDSSRACRTIGGAMRSPFYQEGTQILVSAGFYLEDNPLPMKRYTSVRGSDIRTTFIEPINKTQDLFHVNSGCYLNYMTFLNGRSGLLEGPYEEGFNRGAYATAFPPREGEDRITLNQSPYIQNCTNQSGPWLKDGTMFLPNQTVQVPAAVGTGTWKANQTTVVVKVSTGTIVKGMSVNSGQQNPGYYDARTLLLANKPFIQDQVVAYVDQTFNSGSFVYDAIKCARDTGLIIDSIAIDLLQDSSSESIFAGLQYWRQTGYVDDIGGQITTTTAAISYLKNITSATIATTGERDIVVARFNDILNVLNTSTSTLSTGVFSEWVTNSIVSNTTASTTASVLTAYNTILAYKNSLTNSTINYINGLLTPFSYNIAKCSRDTGLIVDSVALDILYEGRSQSTFAGLQYWDQSSSTQTIIPGEFFTTTNAISYLSTLTAKIITGNITGPRYQTVIPQQFPALGNYGSINEQNTTTNLFNTILTILNTGTTGVSDLIVPNSVNSSTNQNILNAYNVIKLNREYLITEVIAFVEATKTPGFVYTTATCARDTGYIIDSVCFDLLHGGNRQSVMSGVYYFGYTSNTSIDGQIPQTSAAYRYMRQLFGSVIQGQKIPDADLYQTGVAQVLSLEVGTDAEVDEAQDLIDYILNIISNGPTGITRIPIDLNRSSDIYRERGAKLLILNRAFIQAEIVAYVNTLKTFLYDEDTCRRDIGYILDSVAFDLKYGGNKQSFKSGVYYYGYSTNVSEVAGEIPQTYGAYKFLKGLVSSVVLGIDVPTNYQSTITQVLNLNSATVYEAEVLGEKLDIITGIIRNGPEEYSAVGRRIPINLTQNTTTQVVNAFNLLKANRNFIIAETIAYVNTTSNTFIYNREKCRRDVGILVENISYDAVYGGNQKAVESGLSYYDGVISRISGQESQTISAIDYLNSVCQKIIVNSSVTDLLSGTGTNAQVINIVLNGSIASEALEDLFNIVTTIIDNGPSAAPAVYTSPGPDKAFISAQTLIQANRKFIQENTVQYINRVLIPATNPGYFSFSERKCRRDTGIVIDSIAMDLLYPTANRSQSTFAGLAYWGQTDLVPGIKDEINPTISAVEYLKTLSRKIILNITPAVDLIPRYQTGIQQVTTLEPATEADAEILFDRFDEILEILNGNIIGWTDRIVPNGIVKSNLLNVQNAFNLLIANKTYLGAEVNAYVTATNFGFVYDSIKCARDVGYITEAVAFDLLHGGNRQSIQNGLYYYGFTTSTVIYAEISQTIAAFSTLSNIISQVVRNIPVTPRQTVKSQVFGYNTATIGEANILTASINTITSIIANGPSIAVIDTPIALTASYTSTVLTAVELLKLNRDFLIEETIAYVDQIFNPGMFNYNEEKCYRDIGLVIDAVSQDIVLGGNSKSIEAGLSYWSNGYNAVAKEVTTTTYAFNYARNMALQIAKNQPVDVLTGTFATQVINPFFQYGEEYGPQEAIKRNFAIINKIIEFGPAYAPPNYLGGGLFALTGINGSDPLPEPIVVSVTTQSTGTFVIGLDRPTVGFGNNATLYFGDTYIYPLRDREVDELSFEFTGNTSTWSMRKIDQFGGMGGALIDGSVISDDSPIQSFVFDAYTQLTQGGRGVHIKNDGYAQLVSVFTIMSSIGVECESGGIASIVNSNSNFGNICLQAKGYGKRKFTGHIYNPPFKAYPESPNIPGSEFLNQYYPSGFWPNNAQVMVFLPDLDDRPHISLVMEVVPPETVRDFTGQLTAQLNEQGLPGFLNANPTTSTLTTGSITLSGFSTDNIFVGNFVYARDQFGRSTSTNLDVNGNFIPYINSGTIVTNIEFNRITLNQPLTSGGADPDNTVSSVNDNYFNLYFCGNAYYTVLSSEIGSNPQYNRQNTLIPDSSNILSAAALGLPVGQITEHIAAMTHLNTITNRVINNQIVSTYQTGANTTTQYTNVLVQNGGLATTFIDLRFDDMINIIGAANLTAAEAVVPQNRRLTSGPTVQGAGSAITLIEENIEFLADEVSAFVVQNYFSTSFTVYSNDEKANIIVKCQRDTKIILQRLIYDIQTGGNYNMVMAGLSYWRRPGSYHIVSLGEGVTRTDLFPDGATTNFYQRSYMSASGYVFEYVGAGIDYGSLPQRGVSDPKQEQEVVQLNAGKVFFTSTDQNGDFRIGPGLVISQATGVLSGRTFTRSLFANLTPFILAIESGGG